MQIVEPLLGTRAEIDVVATSNDDATAAENAVLAEVARLEQIFTVFDETSALNELRRTGSTASAELVEVIELAEYWHRQSNGAFDPRTQALMELWDQAEAAGKPPSPADLATAIETRNELDMRDRLIDNLNAIAKGWIAQTAVQVVDDREGIDQVWLTLGGDLVHSGSGSMVVGIEDPHRPYDNVAPLATIDIANEAVATSGGARRWWTIDGDRYPKVLDPRSGAPVDRVASATVVAEHAATADVLATICTVVTTDEAVRLVADAGGECLLVHPDRSQTCSSERFVFG